MPRCRSSTSRNGPPAPEATADAGASGALTPQRLDDADERAHRGRAFTMVRNADGSGYTITRGNLTVELGKYLATVIAAQPSTDPANTTDTTARRAQHDRLDVPGRQDGSGRQDRSRRLDHNGPAAGPGPEPRSRVQQDHDALLLALRILLGGGALGSRHKVAPHLAVTVSLDALHESPGALPAVSRTTGTHLPRTLVRKLLCDSSITRGDEPARRHQAPARRRHRRPSTASRLITAGGLRAPGSRGGRQVRSPAFPRRPRRCAAGVVGWHHVCGSSGPTGLRGRLSAADRWNLSG